MHDCLGQKVEWEYYELDITLILIKGAEGGIT